MTVDTAQPLFAGLSNHVAAATVAATQEASGFDADNLKVKGYSDTWRSSDLTNSQSVTVTFADAKTDVEVVAIMGCNFSDVCTWRVQLYSDVLTTEVDDSGTETAFDTSLDPASGLSDAQPWGRPALYLPPAGLSVRSVKVSFPTADSPDGYLEAGCLVIGPALQLGSAQWGSRHVLQGRPGSEVVLAEDSFSFSLVDEAARRRALSLSRALGGTGRFVVVPHPARPERWVHEVSLARLREVVAEEAVPGRRWNLLIQTTEVYT